MSTVSGLRPGVSEKMVIAIWVREGRRKRRERERQKENSDKRRAEKNRKL